MNAWTFILTALLTAIVTPSFAQSFRETNPLSDSGVRTLASWAESQIDENGRLRDYVPTDEPLYTGAVSDGQSSTVKESLQKIAEMMPCEEGKEWKLQQAYADDDAMAAATKTEVHVIGEDDRDFLDANFEKIFAGVGKVFCQHPTDKSKFTFATGTLVGDQQTVTTVAHYRTVGEEYIFKPEDCEYRIYSADGKKFLPFKFQESFRSHPPEEYRKASKEREDQAILKLKKPVDRSVATAIKVRNATYEQVVSEKDTVLVAYHGGSRVDNNRRIMSYNCNLQAGFRTTYFRHSCDMEKGSSGGLIYTRDRNGEVVAIGFSSTEGSGYIQNFGQAFSSPALAYIPNVNTKLSSFSNGNADL